MLDQSFFYKRFSVGLALDTSLQEFNEFLDRYAKYIDNFYFSLPMGDKFHARTRVMEQMRDLKIVELFWKLLECVRSHKIKLELVLNNGRVSCDDVKQSAQMLRNHGIDVDLVGITDEIYDDVKAFFPTQKIVYSFKNHTHTQKDFAALVNQYDEIVLGRQNIRNTQLFSFIQRELHSNVILLLNNGCSHICGGCTTLNNCHRAYYQEKFRHNPEYLYALQSILPFEIHSGLLDVSDVHLFKISSRNASVQYIEDCLNSYIFCVEEPYIKRNTENYMLWSRLAWHSEFFDCFSLGRIKTAKKLIYQGKTEECIPSYVRVTLDLRNHFLFTGNKVPDMSTLEQNINLLFRKIPWQIEGYLIGVSNCPKLLKYVSIDHINSLICALCSTGRKLYFSVPPMSQVERSSLGPLWDSLSKWISSGKLDCVVVNDLDTKQFFKNNFRFPVAFGERITRMRVNNAENDYLTGNGPDFGKGLISKAFREECVQNNVYFILCDMPEGGLRISASEPIQIQASVGLIEKYDGACRQFHERICDGGCITGMNIILRSYCGNKLVICANSICSITRISDGILKTVLENRTSIVVPLIWKELL